MASLSKDGSGWRILFCCPTTKKRRTIRTGKCAKKNAETALNMVEKLVEAKGLGSPINQQVAGWLESIEGTPLRTRLAKAGLCEPVTATQLGEFLEGFIDQRRRRGDVTEATLIVWGHTKRNLVEYFGADKSLRGIKPEEAENWNAWLKTNENLAENTIRKRCQFAKRFFNVAERRRLVERNPFKGLVGTTIPVPERQFFIDRDTVDDLLNECPTTEHRLMLLFARYLGVRVPSEIVPLKWSDVNWKAMQIIITSPKTKRHRDGHQRFVPVFPEVYPALLEASENAPDGAVYIFPSIRSAEKNQGTWLKRAILRTGRKPWPRLWVNFRSSRATELANEYPSHVAAAWLGHTEMIANQHYRQVTSEHVERATSTPTGAMPGQSKLPKEQPAQIPAQSPHLLVNQGSSRNETSPTFPEESEACGAMITPLVEDNGLEPMTFWLPARFQAVFPRCPLLRTA